MCSLAWAPISTGSCTARIPKQSLPLLCQSGYLGLNLLLPKAEVGHNLQHLGQLLLRAGQAPGYLGLDYPVEDKAVEEEVGKALKASHLHAGPELLEVRELSTEPFQVLLGLVEVLAASSIRECLA